MRTDKERKQITRSLTEAIDKVVNGKEQLDENMPVGIGDEVDSALGYIEEVDGVFPDLEDAVKDFLRNFRSAKLKLKNDPKKSVSALKKAIAAVKKDLKAAERVAYDHDKENPYR